MSEIEVFDRERALEIAGRVVNDISPFCDNVIIVGGLRREIPQVHDIDIVAQPNDHFMMSITLGNKYPKVKSEKTKYAMKIDGMMVEVYLAVTERQYEVLKLVRTGSNQFNQNICKSALDKGMALRYSYKDGLCGLYGAASNYVNEEKRFRMFVNPMRKIAYREKDIIMTVLKDERFLDPRNRSLGYEEDYENDL